MAGFFRSERPKPRKVLGYYCWHEDEMHTGGGSSHTDHNGKRSSGTVRALSWERTCARQVPLYAHSRDIDQRIPKVEA